MKIENVEFEFFIDYINKRVHLLDVGGSPQTDLLNNISTDFQKSFIERESLLSDLVDFEWVCYSLEGIIASFKDYDVKLLNPKMPYLHKPFKKVAEGRRNRHKA